MKPIILLFLLLVRSYTLEIQSIRQPNVTLFYLAYYSLFYSI